MLIRPKQVLSLIASIKIHPREFPVTQTGHTDCSVMHSDSQSLANRIITGRRWEVMFRNEETV